MTLNYFVTEASDEQSVSQALTLWERNLSIPIETGKSKYQWYYKMNPYREGKLWLLKIKEGRKTVGTAGVGYRRFRIDHKPLMGALIADLSVDKEHRTLGPALQLQRAIVEHAKKHCDFLYAFPNRRAAAVLRRVGYRKVGDFARLAKVLKTGSYVKRIIKSQALARIISAPIDILLHIWISRALLVGGNELCSDNIAPLRTSLEALWKQIMTQYDIVGERTVEFLNWRYFKCPDIEYRLFGLRDKAEELNQYLIYYEEDNQVKIVDLVCPENTEGSSFRSLILKFEKHCLSSGAKSISISLIGAGTVMQKFRDLKYRDRESVRSLWIYSGDEETLSLLNNVNKSYWFLGDEDNN
jgi:GNAT superfamily N-acetyltransferase